MKTMQVLFFLLLLTVAGSGQATSSVTEILTVYSQNEEYYLRSIPYDNEYPSLRGTTSVYRAGVKEPLYVFERGFDSVESDSNNLIIGNNGEIIFYVLSWGADEEKEGLKSINVYQRGKLLRGYSASEITGCDLAKERCSLLYDNYDEAVDVEKSRAERKTIFKDGITEKVEFLKRYPLFSFDNEIYLVDSKLKVHRFDLTNGSYIGSDSFDLIYEDLKSKGRQTKVVTESHETPFYPDFPKLLNGKDTAQALAEYLGMKTAAISGESGVHDEQFKIYSIKIDLTISRDGSAEIGTVKADEGLAKNKIIQFFNVNLFDIGIVPEVFPKWHLKDYFFFRAKDDETARKEKQSELVLQQEELKKRLTAETINGRYIPRDLEDAFKELDKLVPEVDRKEMASLKDRDGMIAFHFGLGMWIRNNWGLWNCSRLQKYFIEMWDTHPDYMSGVILE